jgi:predicted dehydrogenase
VHRKLKVAIAGTGFGEKYAIGLKAHPQVEVVGVFSRRPHRAAAMAEKYEIPFSTRNFDQLLGLPNLDAVAVVTPNATHAEFVKAAIRARKHVICDKPLALSAREGEELCELAELAAVKHVTFVPYRFSPAACAMRAAVAGGQIGRVVNVRAGWGIDLRKEPLRWRFQRKLSGAGVVADLGAHILDLLIWWLGPVRRVLGRCKTLVPQRPAEVGGRMRPVDVPDECWSLVEFGQAGVGSVRLSWNGRRNQQIEIEGDRGRLTYESPSMLQWLEGKGEFDPSVGLSRPPGPTAMSHLPMPGKEHFTDRADALARMFADVVEYLRGGEKSDLVATFRDGLEVLQIIDAVERSGALGNWVDAAGGGSY